MGEVLSTEILGKLGEEVASSPDPEATGNPLETTSAGYVKGGAGPV